MASISRRSQPNPARRSSSSPEKPGVRTPKIKIGSALDRLNTYVQKRSYDTREACLEESAFTCDVAIVGLGPTGVVLANLLGRKGWPVVGLERRGCPLRATRRSLRRRDHADLSVDRILRRHLRNHRTLLDHGDLEQGWRQAAPAIESGLQVRRYGHACDWWIRQPTLASLSGRDEAISECDRPQWRRGGCARRNVGACLRPDPSVPMTAEADASR